MSEQELSQPDHQEPIPPPPEAAPADEPAQELSEDAARRLALSSIKAGKKALESLRASFGALGAGDAQQVLQLLTAIDAELEALRPPEPRRCKEFLRAVSRKKKGLLGIRPEDVALYCTCMECVSLRDKQGLSQPAGDLTLTVTDAEGTA